MTKTLTIKGMVCPRCVRVVHEDLEKLGVDVKHVEIGKVELNGSFDKNRVQEVLNSAGFDLVEDEDEKLVEKIKSAVLSYMDIDGFKDQNTNNSQWLEKSVDVPYDKQSRIFSHCEGITLERYIILQKIDKAKEHLSYSSLSNEQIAFSLGYSSGAHFSRQFKEVTGFTPSGFRNKFKK